MAQQVKNLVGNAGDTRDTVSVPRLERDWNRKRQPIPASSVETPWTEEAQGYIVHAVAKS